MSTHSAPPVTFEVAERFHSLRRRYLVVNLAIAFASGLTALLAIWVLLAACDYVWEWTITWRKSGLVIGGTAVAVWMTQRVLFVIRGTRQRTFANRLERSFNEFGQRIRTVLDTVDGRVSGPSEMLAALGHQTLGRWETLAPSRLVPSRMLAVCAAVLACASMIAVGFFVLSTDWSIAMRRALGGDLPYTTLTVDPGDRKILEGMPVVVTLELAGRTNRDVVLRHRERSHDKPSDKSTNAEAASSAKVTDTAAVQPDEELNWIEQELFAVDPSDVDAKNSRVAKFTMELGRAVRPVEYQFLTSAGSTRVFRIDVQPLIDATRIEAMVEPPSYTRLATRSFATTDVTVLEQSLVHITIETNHPLSQAMLATGVKPTNLEQKLVAVGDDRTRWTFDLPSERSLHWQFSGHGDDGTPMTPVKGRLRVREDAAPSITWRDPGDEIRVHSLAELPMVAHVSDDYGVTEAGIVFQIGGDDDYVLTDWTSESAIVPTDGQTADGSTPPPATRVKLEEVLPLESFALSERDYISYYAYAVDNRASGQHRVETDVRYIDIRPLRQFFSEIELDPNVGGGGRRVLVQLDEIIRRQRFLINRTRRMTRSSSADLASQLGTLDRMVESQSELAGLTRFLAEFFVSQGNDDVEALNQAEAAMLQAADSLAAGSFDLSLVQEEDALRALAEARRTLEIFLIKNATPAQQRQLQQFARQLRQKLRREKAETEQQIADTLQKLAGEQMQMGALARRLQSDMQNNITQQSSGASGNASMASPMNKNATGGNNESSTATEPSDSKTGVTEARDPAEASTDQDVNANEPPSEAPTNADSKTDADQDANGESKAAGDADSPTLEQQQSELYASEVDLLDRLQAIQDQLADRLAESPLMARRMIRVAADLDSLARAARDGRMDVVSRGSSEAADQLRELGLQLDAISATEAVSRVSAIRDMTSSLANLENDLAESLRSSAANSKAASGEDSPAESSTEADSARKRIGERLRERSETIEEVLKAPVAVGDVETSEVNDHLAKFIEENEFLNQLASSRTAVQPIVNDENVDLDRAGPQAMDRARDYADASQQLDDLYRSLVTPRLAQLRNLEQRASQLAQQLGGGGASKEPSPEAKVGVGKLREDLDQQGFSELAELLESMPEGESDSMFLMPGSNGGENRFDPTEMQSLAGRTLIVVRELRERIQEMILLEISTDRDTPIPVRYRTAVDAYFRTLAGDAGTVDEVKP